MTLHFQSILDLNPQDRFITIKEKAGSNGNYLIVNLLKLLLDNNDESLTILVCVNQIPYHYKTVSKKFGFDLSRISADKFKFIEFCNLNSFINNRISFENQLEEIKNLIQTTSKKINLIFDDITQWKYHLTSPLNEINDYVKTICIPNLLCILLIHVSNEDDEIFANYFAHQSNFVFETKPLQTGFDRNISGVLITYRRLSDSGEMRKSIYHYKLTDRNVKFFPPGQTIVNFQIG